LFATRDWAGAAAAYAGELAEARSRGDAAAIWTAALGECRSNLQAQRFSDAALSCFDGVRDQAAGDAGREVETAYHACLATLRVGRMEEAEGWARRALEAAEGTTEPRAMSQAFATFGNVRSYQGRYREAMHWNEKRVEVWREAAPGSADLALALNNVGIDYRHLGRYDDAAAVLEEALALHRALGDRAGSGPALFNLANVRLHAGDLEAGLALKLEALAVAEETGNSVGAGIVLIDLGEIYRAAGDLALAQQHLERSLAIHREARRASGETNALEGLARLALDRGQPGEAADLARQALALADGSGLGKEQALTRTVLARAEARLGRSAEAVDLARDALRRTIDLDDPDVELEAREALAEVLERAGQPGAAAASYLEAVDLLDSLRGRLELGDLRLGVGELFLSAHEGAIRTLLDLGRHAEAFAVVERARARLLLEMIAEHAARRPADPIAALRAELRERYAERAATDGPRRGQVEGEVRRIERALEAAIVREREVNPIRAASRHPRPLPLDDLRRALVRPDRPLLAWFWGEREVYGFRVDASGVRAAALGPAGALADQVGFLHQALQSPGPAVEWRRAAAALYRRLVAPLGPLSGPEIVVLPDGPLNLLPLEALLPEEDGERPALARTLIYGPSASVLAALARAPAPPTYARTLLAVGVSGGLAAAESGQRDEEALLPHAAREVEGIVGALGGRECDTLLDGAATLPQILALEPRRYRWLHFATHARIVERPADRSSLRLEEGRLDLPAIRALDLRAELVALSACETALGQRVRGEGVVGLTHAFLSAGARAVLASLWKVEDRATAEFMGRFYRQLGAGLSPAAALRETRLSLLRDGGPGAHPSVWAAFVLIGYPGGDAPPQLQASADGG
jgi:CHAT domain-containing protein